MFIPLLALSTALSFSNATNLTIYDEYFDRSQPVYLYYTFEIANPSDNGEIFINLSYGGESYNSAYSIQCVYENGDDYISVFFASAQVVQINYSCNLYYSGSINSDCTLMTSPNTQGDLLAELQIPYSGNESPIYFDLIFYYATEDVFTLVSQGENIQSVYNNGYQQGQQNPTQEVYDNIYNQGATSGYQNGYAHGYDDAFNTDTTALSIFSGILDIGLLPVNVFLAMLNFEVFGINVGGFITGILTIAVTIVLLKAVLGTGLGGGKSD